MGIIWDRKHDAWGVRQQVGVQLYPTHPDCHDSHGKEGGPSGLDSVPHSGPHSQHCSDRGVGSRMGLQSWPCAFWLHSTGPVAESLCASVSKPVKMGIQQPSSGCHMTAGSKCVPEMHASYYGDEVSRDRPIHDAPEPSQLIHMGILTCGREMRSGDGSPSHEGSWWC